MTERVTVEHNGELVTLEVPDGTSDEQIKSFLTGNETKKETKQEATAADLLQKGLQTLAPALANTGPVIPEGMAGQAMNKVGQAISQATPGGLARGALDLGLMAHGQAPWATILKTALPDTSSLLSKPLAESLPEYGQALKALPGQALSGAKNAAGALLRGAGKVAGPVGLGMNAYDAAKYAQEAGLGNRLASGQGQAAEQNFRNFNTPINGPISPEQAQALLENGSPRDIEAAGGQARINELIRQKAAALALRPIAPQQ